MQTPGMTRLYGSYVDRRPSVLPPSTPIGPQPADNDVLLQALERVVLAVDGRLGEHPRRLLERSRGDERTRLQARLGDAEQHRMTLGGFLAFLLHPRVQLV